jgi:transcriptional regulator with XRE-family HTH domain
MGFPERLKELREARGLSQEALADTLGIPRSSITHYEKPEQGEKERLPRRARLEQIADFFGVSVDYLLDRTDDPSPSDKKDKTDELTSIMFHKWDKLDEKRRKQALKLIEILEQEADEENNEK